ncbi:MAG TPA: hypothetical protein VKO18_04575 [Terriglobia bacterium]|nr:hypothetical protein [Terriglobia bacterium]
MSNFIGIGLAGVYVQLNHFAALLPVVVFVVWWALASVVVGLFSGRVLYLFGDSHERPKGILEAPPEKDSLVGVRRPSRQNVKHRC